MTRVFSSSWFDFHSLRGSDSPGETMGRAMGRCLGWMCLLSLLTVGCDAQPPIAEPVPADPDEQMMQPPGACLPDVTCEGTPAGLEKQAWRHSIQSPLVLLAGDPRHRGIDLVASADAPTQTLAGEISYGPIDKALHDEDVELWACRSGSWQRLGVATTDDDGHFEYTLSGANRLPVGQRSILISVLGDRSSVLALAQVLPSGGKVAVSDVDGTLTTYENEFPESLITGTPVKAHDGAPEAFAALAQNCYHPVYLTARGSVFTEPTRSWLKERGFPTGALRLAPNLITIPGDATVEYKAATMAALQANGVAIAVGNGNRASDASAYHQIGLVGDHIFLKRAEYASEIDPVIAAGSATGVDSYRSLIPIFSAYQRAP